MARHPVDKDCHLPDLIGAMIQVDKLTKYYGAKRVLNRLAFRVEAGEIVGLVGKNGTGKSTALRILSGQLLPTSGSVRIDGISVPDNPQAVRERIGYLPEVPPLYKEMTVRAYLAFVGRLRRIPRRELAGSMQKVSEDTGLTDVMDERLGDLSKGYQQRAGIAQAIIHQPAVIMLDEPMAGLDPLQIVQIRDLIVSLRGQHTVLFSSHILSEITNVCDRVILIDQGKVRAEGAEAELRESISAGRQITVLVRGGEKKLTAVVRGINGLRETSRDKAGQNLWRLSLEANEDKREAFSKACIQAGLGLVEMKSDHSGLEDLFVHLLDPQDAPGGAAQ